MGKGTIVRHLGEGQYRVRLKRSTARIEAALARIATDLSVLQERIETAWQELQDTESSLADAIGEINDAIEAISDRIQDLADAVRAARELVDQRTDELRTAQESLDDLEQAKKDDPDSVTDEQIRIATEQRDAKQALLDAAKDQLTGATDAWNNRDVDVKEQDAKIVEAAKLREELSTARMSYNGLLLEKASLEKRKAWLESKRKADPELDAWCADLTEDLDGDVGTIEILGERNAESDPLLIRPGYEGRATYQPKDTHHALIDAKSAALTESIQAQDRVDAAQSALDVEASKRRELQGRLDVLLSQPEPDQAERVFLQGQIEASDVLIPVLEARKATMDEALTAAQAAFDAASQALTAARAADQHPRFPDGMLQNIPAAPGPFSSFFNQALLPAWQKWRPMYRVGTITELAGDRCTVVLDPATSSQQSIDVNQSVNLSNVPIDYMDCDGQAFDVGDRVVVEFRNQDLTKPRVIGFESHPQGCGDHGIIGALAGDDAPSGYHRTKVGSTYYADYKTLRYKDGAWTLGAPPRGTGAATNGVRSFGQFDWVYRRDGKFRGYLTWGHPASNSSGLFFTWFRTQCPNRFGDYSWANILPITYDGRSSAASGSVFLNGKLLAKPAGLLGNRSVAGAALRHVKPAPTADNPNPTERRYVLMVIDQSVIAAGDDNRYGPTMTFGAALYAVDVTDGPVDTNAKWAAKARLIHEIGQLSLTKPSIGNSAYGGVDRFTTFGSRGVRFRFNGSSTRASAVVHAQCQLGYDRNGDARWHDWGEIPLVVHIDIADDLTCTHAVEDPVIGTYTFSGSRWQKKSTGWGTIPPGGQTPPPEIVGEAHYEGSGSIGTTTLMIDYVGDVEKRVTATDRCDYHCHQTFMTWVSTPFDIALNHEVITRIGRHTVTERRLDRRPLGDIGSTEYSGTRTERFQFLAVDPRYDFYAGLRMIYETTDTDPSSPDLPDGATVTFELEVNGVVIQRSSIPSLWFGSTTWSPKWDTGGMYNYINSTIAVDNVFNTMNGTTTRTGAYCLRPIRRATFRIAEPHKWYLDADADPDWWLKIQTTPVIDFVPYALCLTDIAADEANPKTLFVTNCPTLSATTISGKKSDGWGLLAQHQWVTWLGDADGNAVDLAQVFGKPSSLHPRFCGAGLV